MCTRHHFGFLLPRTTHLSWVIQKRRPLGPSSRSMGSIMFISTTILCSVVKSTPACYVTFFVVWFVSIQQWPRLLLEPNVIPHLQCMSHTILLSIWECMIRQLGVSSHLINIRFCINYIFGPQSLTFVSKLSLHIKTFHQFLFQNCPYTLKHF